ncbi:YlbF family regulator [Paenisporosarcina sp. TG-14]|uniref:YlbF family regulator n=1 Tax=Paenisporosarcina sp. TG-14 TaxID=1231057 RepID=UPI0002E48C07|nr:YlbF family regulator [Paenisporosarcina sp. TG-14]
MMMTLEWANIMDEGDSLTQMILSSEQAERFKEAYFEVYTDDLLKIQIASFTRLKEQYEEVQRFGRYHPDYQQVMKSIRVQKRALDMNERVATLKLAENELQDLLDGVSLLIGKTVSESVEVPVSNPFFTTASSCSTGSCGTGGSCGCSA